MIIFLTTIEAFASDKDSTLVASVKTDLTDSLKKDKPDSLDVLAAIRKASPLDSTNIDSLYIGGTSDEKRFLANLDSMVRLWYVEQAIRTDSVEYMKSLLDSTVYSSLPDSVYEKRLSEIESVIDMSYTPQVKRRIEVYTIRGRKYVQTMIGLSQYYFPMFEEILDSYQLPLELKYLPIVESALNPRAVSWAGATGIWQFMYATGKIYNLNINSFVDERRDPVQATHAAAKFLKKLNTVYGDWTLALAAYNCGPGNVNKAIRRSGGKTNYWEIYPYLPRETRGYVPAFIAATYLMTYYEDHDIVPRPTEFPLVSDTLLIKDKLHFGQVAEVLNMPIKQIEDLNPQYRRNIIPKKTSKPYALRLPLEYSSKFIELEDSIYNYKDSIFFSPKSSYKIPKKYVAQYDPPNVKNKTKLHYTIKSGDNLGYISKWYGVKVRDIRHWNGIYRNRIRAGKKLTIYVPKNKAAKYKKVDTMSFEAKQKMIGAPTESKLAAAASKPKDSNFVYYKVRHGDNLWTISKKFPGTSDTDLIKINNFSKSQAKRLQKGQWIKIKKKI